MKKYLFTVLTALLLVSCGNDTTSTFNTVEINTVFSDSLSVRAIVPQDASKVWFAANKGIVGLIDDKTPKVATIRYRDSILNFRAIAKSGTNVFVLSIENPAVLYKIKTNGSEAETMQEVYTEEGEGVFYDAISFWNEKEGIAMGDPINGCLSIIITRDGGTTWNKLSCSVLPPVFNGEAAFAASNTNISIKGNHAWIATGGKRARIFHTSDKGLSWDVYNTPILQGDVMTGIYSIDFYSEKIGVIIGGNWEKQDFNEGNKAITFDGGKSWKLISNGSGPGYRSCIKFIPGTNGKGLVAVGSPGISYSNDQGNTWKELSNEGFYSIAFVNDTLAYASGRNKIARLHFKSN